MRFNCVVTVFLETFISIKFLRDAGNIYYVDTPDYITYPWIIVVSIGVIHYLYLRIYRYKMIPNVTINIKK